VLSSCSLGGTNAPLHTPSGYATVRFQFKLITNFSQAFVLFLSLLSLKHGGQDCESHNKTWDGIRCWSPRLRTRTWRRGSRHRARSTCCGGRTSTLPWRCRRNWKTERFLKALIIIFRNKLVHLVSNLHNKVQNGLAHLKQVSSCIDTWRRRFKRKLFNSKLFFGFLQNLDWKSRWLSAM